MQSTGKLIKDQLYVFGDIRTGLIIKGYMPDLNVFVFWQVEPRSWIELDNKIDYMGTCLLVSLINKGVLKQLN